MEDIQFSYLGQEPETLNSMPSISGAIDWGAPLKQENNDSPMEEDDESSVDSLICESGSRLIPNGFARPNCKEEVVMFVNAGGGVPIETDSSMNFIADTFFNGGDIFQTDEHITEGGDNAFIYQSARLGNFYYQFENLPAGEYYVDLHFVEIINTHGPKGMRGSMEVLWSVGSAYGEHQSCQTITWPIVVDLVAVPQVKHEYLRCNNCAAEVEVPSAQKKIMQTRSTAKYEKKIQELNTQCQRKTDECYQAWMSLNAANEQLVKVRMELDNKLFQTLSLDQTVEKQAEALKNISSRYERDKKFWTRAISNLEEKLKVMKEEHSQLSCEAHECADSVPELYNMVFAVQSLGNIRVFCRCRPLSKVEVASGHATVVDFDVAKDGELGILTSASTRKAFKFDRVYTPKDDQVDVFADASPMVISVLDGYNVCIFAYGQTGTGKTFTMEGTEQNRGVNYRTLEELFKTAKERSETFTYSISVSVLEVYNEQIRDLLAASPTSKKLEIKQATEGFHHVPGIVEARVENIREVWNVLQAGSNARVVGSNNVNEHSSRSHCMLCIMVRAKNLMNGECTKSKLWLVDLAGSERLAKTDVQGDRLKEAQNINRSLSALGDVISALAARSSHIPYSPSEQDLSETLSSLNFATRVRGVELGPARKQIDTAELQKMKMMLDKARQESRSKDESLRKLEDSLQNLESKARGKDQFYRNQQEKIKELESQLELKGTLHIQSEKQVLHMSERLKEKDENLTSLQQKVKELENKLSEQEQSEATTYQQAKDLENKLKEQLRESESYSVILKHKVEELERKLEEKQDQHSESILHQKIMELENKLGEEQKHRFVRKRSLDSADDALRATTTPLEEGKQCVRHETVNDIEQQVLRNSNSINCRGSRGPSSLKGNDSLPNTSRKRLSRNGETENYNNNAPNSSNDIKPSAVRTRRATKTVTTSQKPIARIRANKDPVQGIKEMDNKKRIWS
ncbi:hypothetical protein U1Q18_039692 [Sarracenia purpurea var. burkii]